MNSVNDNLTQSRFEWEHNGELAIAQYHASPGRLTVTHIFVPPSIRGQGAASALASAIVRRAQTESLQIVPLCSFMSAYLKRHPELESLRAQDAGLAAGEL